MKCIAAVVMMAFIASANAGIASLALPYAAWGSPIISSWNPTPGISQYSSIPASSIIAHSAPIAHSAWAAPIAHSAWAAPIAHSAWAAPAPIAHAAAIIPGEARYTAINRGSVHDAPLPGHALSQTSLNLAPAPGTL